MNAANRAWPDRTSPAALLSNGQYLVLITGDGCGFSACGPDSLTAWRGDRLEARDGFFVYIRDIGSRNYWSAGRFPTPTLPGRYTADRRPGRFEILRVDHEIESRLEVAVAADAPAELRRITLVNHSGRRRLLELTSYAEVVLQAAAAHAAHPAFSRLFVQTELAPGLPALLARRRPRGHLETHPWLFHSVIGAESPEFETDRARFLGRHGGPENPAALETTCPLSGTVGNVLDPIVSLRCRLSLEAGASAGITFVLGAAPDRRAAVELAGRLSAASGVDGVFRSAAEREAGTLGRLGVGPDEAGRFERTAAAMLYGEPCLRGGAEVLARARGPLDALWRYGLSPSNPLVVLRADRPGGAALVGETLRAHRYWRALGLPVGLVVVTEHGDVPDFAPAAEGDAAPIVRRRSEVPPADLDRMEAVARLVLPCPGGGLPGAAPESVLAAVAAASGEDGLPVAVGAADPQAALFPPAGATAPTTAEAPPEPPEPLAFANGTGGFTADGGEYVIRLQRRPDGTIERPPRPWINVVANEEFGFLISEAGATCTWHENSRENRITPWYNDPLLDPHGEALYIRDEETGEFWSPLPGPVPGPAGYEMRHGFGYSRCRHTSRELALVTTLCVPRAAAVRIATVRVTNTGRSARRLSLFSYCRLVLGVSPEGSGRFVVTGFDDASRLLVARNSLAGDFREGIVFAAAIGSPEPETVHVTGCRDDFIGVGGGLSRPQALRRRAPLDGRTGAGLDPCFGQQVPFTLPAGESREFSFLLGAAAGVEEARSVVARYRPPGAAGQALEVARDGWLRRLSAIQITTPSPALDVMVNGWLPYQTLACRLWARTALYQSGGAFGFRDQLQDAAALVHLDPGLARRQILLHAAHQFVEGDVLHWWHPPLSRGIRTRFADDLLWLPALAAYYAATTGDWRIFDEDARFLAARRLESGEDEILVVPADSGESGDLYEHCVRAIERSLPAGRHGLPLFGTGDWNDGMNRVGRDGRGESVWMGFFLYRILADFLPVCRRRGDDARARRYAARRDELRAALDEAGWDGAWYRRGYYDDGTPLGSRGSNECRIDALAQAWAVLSHAAPPERAAAAMKAVEEELISESDGVIRLLTPPFENSDHDPGYIKGYVPGVRENGGQYTHAALWVAQAMAELGLNNRAARLLDLLNPVHHARTPEETARYMVEPYVVAADVYGAPPHVGRGGWTWYTGSAGWMFRVAVESILGVTLHEGNTLRIRPCIPDDWPSARIRYRVPADTTVYDIEIVNGSGCARCVIGASLDGTAAAVTGGAAVVPVVRDGGTHHLTVDLGAGAPGPVPLPGAAERSS